MWHHSYISTSSPLLTSNIPYEMCMYVYGIYGCTVHLDINVYVYQLMHIFINLREFKMCFSVL
jgi:hypothetical protein